MIIRVVHRAGFSLVELLVVLAIVSGLAALGLAGLGAAQRQRDEAAAWIQLKLIGTAILIYSADHDGRLPGALFPGQMPTYDATRPGRLVVDLADYLGIPPSDKTFVVSSFVPPGFSGRLPAGVKVEEARPYVMNTQVLHGGAFVDPWACQPNPAGEPMRLGQIEGSAQAWAFSDADQQHPQVAGKFWKSFTPAEPIHAAGRQAFFFDGHAERLPAE